MTPFEIKKRQNDLEKNINVLNNNLINLKTVVVSKNKEVADKVAAISIKDGKDGKDGVDGIDGIDGKDGLPGRDGKDGKTPVKGVDYYTKSDKEEILINTLSRIRQPKDGQDAVIDETKIVNSVIETIKEKELIDTSHVKGLRNELSSYRNQMAMKQTGQHGGGDTIAKGNYIFLTRNPSGTTTITAKSNNKRDELSTLVAFGDSLTAGGNMGAGATAADRYANRVAAAKNWSLTNIAVAGSQLPSMFEAQTGNYPSVAGQNFITMLGLNDLRYYGPNPKLARQFETNIAGLLASLAVPDVHKKFSQTVGNVLNTGQLTFVGTWVQSLTWQGLGSYAKLGGYSATAGDTVTTTVTGDTVHILTGAYFVLGNSQLRVTIDGVVMGNGSISTGAVAETPDGIPLWQPKVLRYSGLTNTTHTVTVTINANLATIIGYIAGFDSKTFIGSNIYVGNCIPLTATGWNTAPNKNSVSQAATDSQSSWFYEETAQNYYNQIIKRVCDNLKLEGMNVNYVDTAAGYNPLEALDNIHPNAHSDFLFANKFLNVINE